MGVTAMRTLVMMMLLLGCSGLAHSSTMVVLGGAGDTPYRSATAIWVARAYSYNQVAEQQWIGKQEIQVYGQVHSVRDHSGRVEVNLRTHRMFPLEMRMRPGSRKIAAMVERGDDVVIQCRTMKYSWDQPTGYDCFFIQYVAHKRR